MIDEGLILVLDKEYDEVMYDKNMGLLKITVYKDYASLELKDIMNRLSKQVPYPVCFFKSDNDTYTFSYFIEDD